MALQKILWALDIDPEKININSMGLFEDYIMQARATLPTAEVSDDEAMILLAKAGEVISDIGEEGRIDRIMLTPAAALRALSSNGYKIVRKS